MVAGVGVRWVYGGGGLKLYYLQESIRTKQLRNTFHVDHVAGTVGPCGSFQTPAAFHNSIKGDFEEILRHFRR